MSTLVGKNINASFRSLLRIPDDANGITGTLQTVEDGEGTASPLQLSATKMNVTGGFSIESVDMTLVGSTDGQIPAFNSGTSKYEPVSNVAKLDVAQEYTKAQNFDATSLVALGADLVTNGGFTADSDWAKGPGWSIAAGVASSDGSQAGDSDLNQALSLTNGQTYEVEFTVSNFSAGNVTPVAGDTEGTDRAADGTFTENIVAGAGGDIDIRADLDFIGDIDDVTVKLVNVSWNLEENQVTELILDGNLVLDNPTNQVAGATYIITLTQDGTGSRTLSFGTAYKFPGGTAPTLTTAGGAIDIITFISNGTSMFGVFQGDFS